MFTGIIETLGRISDIKEVNGNLEFEIESPFSDELKVDQSVAHNGVCLTVTKIDSGKHYVTAIQETLRKSNFGKLRKGDLVNLERSMRAEGRFDGHIVQGHVDQTGICQSIIEEKGSHVFVFKFDEKNKMMTVEKGSITVNGVSLTVVDSKSGQFSVAIIPYTFKHTNFQYLKVGNSVNLEFDIIGKYVQKILGK